MVQPQIEAYNGMLITTNLECKEDDVIEICLIGTKLFWKCNDKEIKYTGMYTTTVKCIVNEARYKAAVYAKPRYGDIEIKIKV